MQLATSILELQRTLEIEVDRAEIIAFPEKLGSWSRFILIEYPPIWPFKWLQCVDDPMVAFIVIEPCLLWTDYSIPLSGADAGLLRLSDAADATVLCIVKVPEEPLQMTADLSAPLIINRKEKVGKQLDLAGSIYPTEHRVFKDQA